MKLPSKIFMVGAPGSRWSGIAQNIEQVPGFNISDRDSTKNYTHHGFTGHVGAYFGTGWEGNSFEEKDLDKPFASTEGTRIFKSHEWAYCLDEIHEKYPNDWIVLVHRPDLACQAWWHEAGGFNIAYPDYKPYYKDYTTMLNEIIKMNNSIFEFSQKHDLSWNHISGKWIKDNFGHEVTPSIALPDTLVTILKG